MFDIVLCVLDCVGAKSPQAESIEAALFTAYAETEKAFLDHARAKDIKSGSTAVTAVIAGNKCGS